MGWGVEGGRRRGRGPSPETRYIPYGSCKRETFEVGPTRATVLVERRGRRSPTGGVKWVQRQGSVEESPRKGLTRTDFISSVILTVTGRGGSESRRTP